MGSLSLDVFLSQVFLSLETFLQKATTLNIFESLLFNYKIKVDSAEKCLPQVTAVVVELCNELQTSLRDNLAHTEWKDLAGLDNTTHFCNLQPVNPIFPNVSTTSNATGKSESWSQAEPESRLNLMDNEEAPPPTCSQEMLAETVPAESKPSAAALSKYQLKCDQCSRKFRTNARLMNHACKTAVQDAQPLISDFDESSHCVDDPTIPTIEYSNNSDVSDLPVFVCAACFATYSEHGQFEQHVCKESDTSANEKPTLVLSQRQLQKMRSFVCGICCETYRSLSRIMYHVVRCRTGPYLCELCTNAFANKHELNRHKKKTHKGVECFFCGECGLGFQLRTSLQKHQVKRHESEQGKYTCDVEGCHSVFTKRIYLTNHKLEDHGVERKYLCQVCGNKFLTKTSLTQHLLFHTDKKKYQCAVCTKVLCTKEKLTFHVRTHTGERPFSCETCSKSFVSKAKLLEHMRRHRGEKPHKCRICDKTYSNKIDLTHHIKKIHTPENALEDTPAPTPDIPVPVEYSETVRVTTSSDSAVSMFPSRMLVQLDNSGSVFPIHPIQLVDPASQYYQSEPLQLVRTLPVSMQAQNLVLGYETITY